ncbi:MAG: hypothetical protein AB1728_06345 [Bacteroidota bacterium]
MKTWKRISVGAVIVLLLGIFSCEDPNAAGSEFTVTISGRVENRAQSGQDSVVITLNKPFRRDTTKSDGSFSYSFVSSEKNAVDATLSFRHMNLAFRDTSIDIQYSSTSKSVALGVVQLTGITPGVDSAITGRPSLRAGVIVLKSVSFSTISIRGAGSNDASILTFEVKDSLGVPVDDLNKTTVFFTLVNKPDLLTELNKTSAVTNSAGQASVQLTAGNRSGLAQVQAYALVKRASDTTQTDTIKSPIISLTIAGGLPVASRFTIGSQKYNVPGLVKFNLRNTITAVVGDTFGNPVQKGTVVYFSTTGGIIQPTATTSEDGTVGIDLITGNPIPANGIAVITAQVGTTGGGGVNSKQGFDLMAKSKSVDEGVIVKGLRSKRQSTKHHAVDIQTTSSSGSVFTRTLNILFSGTPRITSNDSVFVVPTLGSKQINFTVADENGNPLSQGTTIKVTGIGTDTSGAVLSGDLDKNLPDTYDRSWTQFSINVADRRTKNLSATVPINISIEVTGENGNVKKTFLGYLTSAVSDSGKVGSISLTNSSIDSIRVAGVGQPNSLQISARVLTAGGAASPGIPVNFSIVKSVEGGEYLSTSIGITDNNGVASTTLFSGVKSGLVKVQASVIKDSLAVSAEPKNVYIRTGPLASIALISVDKNEISVKGVGGDENATVIYEARDLLGNPLDISNQSMLYFELAGVTGFDEAVKPDSSLTNPFTGRVNINVSGGTRSTVLQVVARDKSGAIKSSPVPIVVHGGFAVDSLFVFTNVPKNISIKNRTPNVISMQVGDRYGNPVKPGTAVYFETNAGIIGASSFADNQGVVQTTFTAVADLIFAGDRYFKATTIGENKKIVSDSVKILMSGAPIITVTNVPTDTVTLFDGTSTTIDYVIQDALGNPISSGHNYQVSLEGSVAGQLQVLGDVAGVMPDTDDKINGTKFSFVLTDQLLNAGTGGNFKIKIQTTGVTGTTVKTVNGKLLAPSNIVVPPSARVPASIRLVSVSATDISITGVGGTENSTITYEVLDSVGAPIPSDSKAKVNFKANFHPNGFTPGGTGPTILPTLDSTDENGKVRVSVTSGTQAGAVQIEASITLTSPVRTIKSQPVTISINSGFADQAHFTIAPDRYNFPGLQKAFYSMPITIQAGDKHSNPVKTGTVIYFNTANGIIQTRQGLTNDNGFVTMSLYSGNPYPLAPNLASGLANGFSRVYASTIGKDSTIIKDSVEILWSGSPVITKTGGPATFTIANAGSAGPFTFTVADYLGHPMSQGTTIAVEGSGLKISGDANITMPDTKSSGAGLTSFTISIEDSDPNDTDAPLVSILTVNVSHPVYGVYKLILATGTVD